MSEVSRVRLDELTDTCSDHERTKSGLTKLKESIESIGLICPIAIDENKKLLAGRRRVAALKELGQEEVPCVVFPADEELSLRVGLDENLRHKPMTDPEVAAYIKQLDDVKREKRGSKSAGNPNLLDSNKLNGWTQKDTADLLGISQPTVSQGIKIAEAVEEHPDWAGHKGSEILTMATFVEDAAKEKVDISDTSPDKILDDAKLFESEKRKEERRLHPAGPETTVADYIRLWRSNPNSQELDFGESYDWCLTYLNWDREDWREHITSIKGTIGFNAYLDVLIYLIGSHVRDYIRLYEATIGKDKEGKAR